MKKITKIISIVVFVLIFSALFNACRFPNLNSSQKIMAPKNNTAPIQGTWEIVSYKSCDKNSSPNKDLIGQTAEFNSYGAIFSDEICKDPKYKIKVVSTNSYLFYNYKVNHKDLGINQPKIEILSVTSKNKLFYDFIRLNDSKLLLCIDGTFYTLKKISNNTQDIRLLEHKFNSKTQNIDTNSKLKSGVFISLRADNDDIKNSPSTYRTIWISSINKKPMPIIEHSGIFIPRKTGFWFLNVNRIKKNNFKQDIIDAFPINTKEHKNSTINNKKTASNKINSDLFTKILFVGNDYLSTEDFNPLNTDNYLSKFKVLPIDNLNSKTGVKISDLMDNSNQNILKDSLNSFLSVRNDKKHEYKKQIPSEENFAMIRRNGHWVLIGRLNSNINKNNFINYDINAFPPKKLLNYDDLSLSWGDIKNCIPTALDVFTSPNGDIALIVCTDTIYIYSINNKYLSNQPLAKIPIKTNESIIMAEWATGEYVNKWQASFKSFINSYKKK